MANLPAIQSGIGSITGVLAAVPQIAGLFGSSVAQTVGYQPQGPVTTPAANILGTLNSSINSLFGSGSGLPPTLLFHYEGEQTATFECDITDHWVADNSYINDQIAIKPGVITTQGFIGELNDVPPNKALQALQITANTLTAVSSFAPGLSVTALEAYNEAFLAYQTLGNAAIAAQAAWGSISGSGGESVISAGGITTSVPNQNKQQTMFQQLFAYQQARVLFTIQTPWAVFQNCALGGFKTVQDPDTQVITSFSCTFKQMRFVSSLLPKNTSAIAAGRLSAQSQTVVNNGSSTPSASSTSFSSAYAQV